MIHPSPALGIDPDENPPEPTPQPLKKKEEENRGEIYICRLSQDMKLVIAKHDIYKHPLNHSALAQQKHQ